MGMQTYTPRNITPQTVKNPDGELVGHVMQELINPRTGQPDFMVLLFSSSLGIHDKLYAIPRADISGGSDHKPRLINMPTTQLKALLAHAPGASEGWPVLSLRA